MASFSPSLMSRFPVKIFKVKQTYSPASERPLFHFSGSLGECFALIREAQNDQSVAGERVRQAVPARSTQWAGFIKGSAQTMIDSGYSIDAQAAFDSALASLSVKHDRAPATYREAGGSWSIPRTLSGHPRAAFHRPKTRLPAKDWHIGACFSASVKAPDVAAPLAKLARAAWSYLEQGGAVSLTIHYSALFSRPHAGADGILLSIKVPLSNPAAIATACSVTFFRCVLISFGVALSGESHDSLPAAWLLKPGLVNINGRRLEDSASLRTLGIL